MSCYDADLKKLSHFMHSYGKGTIETLTSLPENVVTDLKHRYLLPVPNESRIKFFAALDNARKEYWAAADAIDKTGCREPEFYRVPMSEMELYIIQTRDQAKPNP